MSAYHRAPATLITELAAGADQAHRGDQRHRRRILPVAGERRVAGQVDGAGGVGQEGGVTAPVCAVILNEVAGQLDRLARREAAGGDVTGHIDQGGFGGDGDDGGHGMSWR